MIIDPVNVSPNMFFFQIFTPDFNCPTACSSCPVSREANLGIGNQFLKLEKFKKIIFNYNGLDRAQLKSGYPDSGSRKSGRAGRPECCFKHGNKWYGMRLSHKTLSHPELFQILFSKLLY